MSGTDEINDKILRLDISGRNRSEVIDACMAIIAEYTCGNFDVAIKSLCDLEFHLYIGRDDYLMAKKAIDFEKEGT